MSNDFEKLNIILAARDREFAKAMERNTRRVEKFSRNSNRGLSSTAAKFDLVGRSARMLGPLMAGVSFGALIAGAQSAVSSLDEIGKTADRIGITTDALQELRVVAESAGVTFAQTDTALEKFSKGLGEASLGIGQARIALDRLNLEGADLQAMGLDGALGAVADAMADIADPTERTALAMQLFGRSGSGMLTLLREGSVGMNQMREDARALGVVVDEALIRKAEAAQTQLDLMARVIKANVSVALIELAPLLVSTANGMASIAQSLSGLSLGFNPLPELLDADGVRALADEYGGLERELAAAERAKSAFESNANQFGAGSDQALAWAERQAEAENTLREAVEARQAAQVRKEATLASIGQMGADLADARERARLLGMSAQERERERIATERIAMIERTMGAAGDDGMSEANIAKLHELADAWAKAETAASGVLNQKDAGGGGAAATQAAEAALRFADYAEVLAFVNDQQSGAAVSGDNYAQMLAAINALQESGALTGVAYADAIGALGNEFSEVKAAAEELEAAATSALVSIFNGSQSAGDAVSGLLSKMGDMAMQSAFQPVMSTISTSLSGAAQSIFSGPSFDGGGYTGAGARSGGLDGKGGFMAMLHPQESVIDHTKSGGGGGGGANITQVFEVNVQGGAGADPDAILSALRPAMRAEAAKVFSRNRRERV